jgi:hypothetical protein
MNSLKIKKLKKRRTKKRSRPRKIRRIRMMMTTRIRAEDCCNQSLRNSRRL